MNSGPRDSITTTARRRQGGQAVVWLLAMLATAAAVMLAVYSTTQVTVSQQRTVNAADAAALAGATVEARMLNLMAYNNRSIIANEAFLVQMMSLESWTQYIQNLSTNFSRVTRFIPYVGAAISAMLSELAQVAKQAHNVLGKVIDTPLIPLLEASKQAAALAHLAIANGGSLMAEDAAKTVVQGNRTTFNSRTDAGAAVTDSSAVRGLTFAYNAQKWISFTQRYTGNQRTDARAVLLASRDDFSADRSGGPLDFDLYFTGADKLGGSQLKRKNSSADGFDRWETEDTYELWTRGAFGKKNYIPIGWGRTNADQNGTKGYTWSPNRSAQSLARSQGTGHRSWSGVPSLYDIRDKTVANRSKLELPFAVVVERAQTNAMTAAALHMGAQVDSPAGSPHMQEQLDANRYHAMAKARVFFERPRRNLANDFTASSFWRGDNAKEYGSLFSPYWQARLTDFTLAEKAALMTAMGLTPDHAIYTPGGQR